MTPPAASGARSLSAAARPRAGAGVQDNVMAFADEDTGGGAAESVRGDGDDDTGHGIICPPVGCWYLAADPGHRPQAETTRPPPHPADPPDLDAVCTDRP